MVNNGFDMVNNKSIFIQRKITMQERDLCWPPYFFPQCSPSFFILESPLLSAEFRKRFLQNYLNKMIEESFSCYFTSQHYCE